MSIKYLLFLPNILFCGLIYIGCSSEDSTQKFLPISSEKSGITFANNLKENPDFNILNYLYFYDGGGVSIGDINGDDLPDLYFTANMLPNRLYLNRGNFEFEDITETAGVAGTDDWTTGTTMADVNGDGLLDIYTCSVNYLIMEGRNQLFINNGDSTFSERAEEYGLNFQGYSKHATFFDYDGDGDLDLFLLNHAVHSEKTYTSSKNRNKFDALAGDRLFENRDGSFVNVSEEANIYSSAIGYGLAATVSDINMDGCPDLYVSNDFHENDYLYLNNCDGTFTDVLEEVTGHTSQASMGNDIADINNDLRPDIFVLDMLPYEEDIIKSSDVQQQYEVYKIQRAMGYHPQYTRNTLQLNLGKTTDGKPFFSEVGQFSGVQATDWSWASLLFDIDNDGLKDLMVSNGIYRRPNDLDYLVQIRLYNEQQSLKGNIEYDDNLSQVEIMPHGKIPNLVFSNKGNAVFTRENTGWGADERSYSSGMAYGDLDSDGDLDVVVNNVNSPATIYQNLTREQQGGNFLKVKMKGKGKNTTGIGSKVIVWNKNRRYLYEQTLSRGFLSSMDPAIHIGLDTLKTVDSLTVIWPDNKYQTLEEVSTNQTLSLSQEEAEERFSYSLIHRTGSGKQPLFMDITDSVGVGFSHKEDNYSDFDRQKMMPHELSAEGPKIAKADVNGDGLEDFYIGGAKYQSGKMFVQQEGGTFIGINDRAFTQDAGYEDVDAEFFDANGNGAMDLYVVSGGNEYSRGAKRLEDRLYFNDGKGNFARIFEALPPIFENGATVAAADFEGDGDTDLFIGNRSVPGQYGVSPGSYLLENSGRGEFRDVTEKLAPDIKESGMITDAVWEDIEGNGYPDLIVVGEWIPVMIFENTGGKLEKSKLSGLKETNGWWNKLEPGDFDGDGDIDFIAGNVGLNSFFHATENEPLVMYLKNFTKDGKIDPVIGYTKQGVEYPVAARDEQLLAFEFLRSKFPTYRDYAGATIQDIFGDHLQDAEKKEIYMMRSVVLDNQGDGSFEIRSLPTEVQFAPVRAIESGDLDKDGDLDLLIAGNFHPVKPVVGGRYDASYGWYLKGRGDGSFEVVEPEKSGFIVRGETRDIQLTNSPGNEKYILATRNDENLLLFKFKKEQPVNQ